MKQMKKISIRSKKYNDYEALYDVKEDSKSKNKKNSLIYSRGSSWTNPGKKAYTLEDDGNNYIFTDHHVHSKKRIILDSCQLEALTVLAELMDDEDKFALYGTLTKIKKAVKRL